MPGLFDDVLQPERPQAAPNRRAAAPSSGLFDDVLTEPAETPSLGARAMGLVTDPLDAIGRATLAAGRLGLSAIEGAIGADSEGALRRGATGLIATPLQTGSEFVERTVVDPLRGLGATLAQGVELQPLDARARQILAERPDLAAELVRESDPLGTAAIGREAAGVRREIAAERALDTAAYGGRPTLGQFAMDPQAAARQLGQHLTTQGVESAPQLAVALATRNPEAASNILAGYSGAETYADLRGQGASTPEALQAAALSALAEKAGEDVALPRVMGEGSILGAATTGGAQEALVSLAQTQAQDQALGRETAIGEQLLQALEAGAVGFGLEGGAGGAFRLPGAIASLVPSRADAARTNAITTTPGLGREATADLDALLAAQAAPVSEPPDVARGAGTPAAAPAAPIPPEEVQRATQPPADTGPQPARGTAAGASPAESATAPAAGRPVGVPGGRAAADAGPAGEAAPVGAPAPETVTRYTADDFLPGMETEVGWSQRGGQLMRERQEGDDSLENFAGRPTGAVTGRTAWVGKLGADGQESRLWRDKPDDMREEAAIEALRKAAAGEPLRAKEARFVEHARAIAAEYADAANRASDEYREELAQYDAAELAESRRAMREELGEIDDADADTALEIDDLVHRAYAAGATQEAILDATFTGSGAEQARALWSMIGQLEVDNAGREAGPQGGREGAGEREGRAAEPSARVAQQTGGLFPAATPREEVAAETARRDRERSGYGAERTDMAAGDGELFAGPRPEQAEIPARVEAGRTFTRDELERMDIDELDRMAFGVADGDTVTLRPDQIEIQYEGDLENPQHKFDTEGMRWVRSVDLSEPVEVQIKDDGRYYLADGHHRWFAAQKLGKSLQAVVEIKGNPINAILRKQEGAAGSVAASRDLFVTTRGQRQEESRAEPTQSAETEAGTRPQDRDRAPAERDTGAGLRPDATPAVIRRGQLAIESLVRRFGGSVVADSIVDDLRDNGTAQLIGKTVNTPDDLAAIADVYRNPAFETLRYIYTDANGVVVGETAVSNREPSSADAFPHERSFADGVQWALDARPEKATKLWLIHNHPSGNPQPSGADIGFTEDFSAALGNRNEGLHVAGHVILNHGRFGSITPAGTDRGIHEIPGRIGTPDPLRQPSALDAIKLETPSWTAELGKHIYAMTPDNSVAVVVVDADRRAVTLAAIPAEALATKAGAALITRIGKKRGAAGVVLVADLSVVNKYRKEMDQAANQGLVLDVVAVKSDGGTSSLAQNSLVRSTTFGKRKKGVAALRSGRELYRTEIGEDQRVDTVRQNYLNALPSDATRDAAERLLAGGNADADWTTLLNKAPDVDHNLILDLRSGVAEDADLTVPQAEPTAAVEQGADRLQIPRARAAAKRNQAAQTLPVQPGVPGWNYDRGVWQGVKGQAKEARVRLQDKMTGWDDVQKQIESQVGAAIPDAQDVYRAENLMHGRVGAAIERLEADRIGPLMQALRDAGVKIADFEEYLYARHAKERNAQIATINPAMPDGGSGMTNAEADAILAAADTAKLEPLSEQVDALAHATRRRLLEHGLIDQATFDKLESTYEYYVPLRGKADVDGEVAGTQGGAGRGLDTRGQPTRRALGRGAGNRAENILAEVIGDAQRAIIASEKARVGRTLMRLVLANPNPDLWEVEPVTTEQKLDSQGQVYQSAVNDWNDPSVIAVRHDGQLYRVKINQPQLAQALNHIGVDQMPNWVRKIGALNRFLSAMLTKYNPAFTGVNATRDALFGLTGLAAEHGEAIALKAALSYPKAAASAFRAAFDRLGNSPMDQRAREFAGHGGKTGYVNMPSVEDIQKALGGGAWKYSENGAKRAANAVADVVGGVNDAVENALRLAAYSTLRDAGMSAEQAASYAKDLTVNFNRKGLDGSTLNSLFLFYNASLQGAKRVGDLAKKPKTWAYLGALATAQVLSTLAMLGMEDDDGVPLWDKIPDHVKQRNIVLPTKDGQHFLTVPMPYGFNLMTWLAGRGTDAFARPKKKGNDAGTIAAETGANAVQAFSPVPLDDGALGLVPTAVRIPLSVQVNKDAFDRPIRREDPYSKSAAPRASMGRPDTLELFKSTATGLNRLGGGDDYTPPKLGAFDVAPEDLEFLLGQLTGGAGRFVLDSAKAAGTIAHPDESIEPRKIPIANKFASNISDVDASRSLFYERREYVERALDRVRDVAKKDGVQAAEKLMKTFPELEGARFKRTDAGDIVGEKSGNVKIVGKTDSLFDLYKRAEKSTKARNTRVRQAYEKAPAVLLPNAATRKRDAEIREADAETEQVQARFNGAWSKAIDQ